MRRRRGRDLRIGNMCFRPPPPAIARHAPAPLLWYTCTGCAVLEHFVGFGNLRRSGCGEMARLFCDQCYDHPKYAPILPSFLRQHAAAFLATLADVRVPCGQLECESNFSQAPLRQMVMRSKAQTDKRSQRLSLCPSNIPSFVNAFFMASACCDTLHMGRGGLAAAGGAEENFALCMIHFCMTPSAGPIAHRTTQCTPHACYSPRRTTVLRARARGREWPKSTISVLSMHLMRRIQLLSLCFPPPMP